MSIPGLATPRPAHSPVLPTNMFMAEVASDNSILYAGIRMEIFLLPESMPEVEIGASVRCLYVSELQQLFVLDQIS